MKRGEVWWANLPDPLGSGPGYRRPVLVVQANSFNRSQIRTVVVAPITSNLALAGAPGNVRLSKSRSGLSRPSVINASQLIALDRSLLTGKVGTLDFSTLAEVDRGLKMVLAL